MIGIAGAFWLMVGFHLVGLCLIPLAMLWLSNRRPMSLLPLSALGCLGGAAVLFVTNMIVLGVFGPFSDSGMGGIILLFPLIFDACLAALGAFLGVIALARAALRRGRANKGTLPLANSAKIP